MSTSNSPLFQLSADVRAFRDAFLTAMVPQWKQALADEIARRFDTRSENGAARALTGEATMTHAIDWVQRLGKWRMVFTGWQLGTRPKGDPEGDAVRDHRELTMALRAEVNALTGLLIAKGVFTAEEFTEQFQAECKHLCESYERRFPGFKATDDGMTMDLHIARDTMAG